jgi:hypothetical protein
MSSSLLYLLVEVQHPVVYNLSFARLPRPASLVGLPVGGCHCTRPGNNRRRCGVIRNHDEHRLTQADFTVLIRVRPGRPSFPTNFRFADPGTDLQKALLESDSIRATDQTEPGGEDSSSCSQTKGSRVFGGCRRFPDLF